MTTLRSRDRLESLLDEQGEHLIRAAIEKGRSGDVSALRLAIDRLMPPLKDRLVQLDLEAIETVNDLLHAIGVVIGDVARGKLTPSEGSTLVSMLSAMRSAFESCEMAQRLDAIERVLPPIPGSGQGESL
jgi:translation elongation factor EF-Tu-like GTPase